MRWVVSGALWVWVFTLLELSGCGGKSHPGSDFANGGSNGLGGSSGEDPVAGLGSAGSGQAGAATGPATSLCDPVREAWRSCLYYPNTPSPVCQDCDYGFAYTAGTCVTERYSPRQVACAEHRCADVPVPGAESPCGPGQLCVLHVAANLNPLSMNCVDDTCGPGEIAEECAAQFCAEGTGRSYLDLDDGGVKVTCMDPAPPCPDAAPAANESCPLEGMDCLYQDCSGAGATEAKCVNGLWQTQSAPCQAPYPCECEPDTYCFIWQGGPYTKQYCRSPGGDGTLVGEMGFNQLCGGYDGSASILGGGVTIICQCTNETGICG